MFPLRRSLFSVLCRLLLLIFGLITPLNVAGQPARAQEGATDTGIAPGKVVTIRIGGASPSWGIPDRNSTSPSERARRAVFDAFSRKYPNIKLERYSSLSIQGPAAEAGLLMAFGGGTAPDVVYTNFRQLRVYVDQGFLRPVDDLIARNPDALARVQPSVRRVLPINDHTYSVPYAQYVQALYYRKDLFRAAGLDPSKPPQNWDEFYADCQALTDQNKGQWGFSFEQGEESYYWIDFLWSAGGDVAMQQPNGGPYLACFNTPAGVAALDFYRKLILAPWKDKNGKTWNGVANRSSTRRQDMLAGRLGMWFQYQSDDIANMSEINPSLIGIAPMPKGPTGLSANELNSAMWSINAAVTDPDKLNACWTFLRYMGSEEAAHVRTTAYVENGLGQQVNPIELKRWGYNEYVTKAQEPWMKANSELFEHGKPEPNGPGMSFIYKLMNEPLDESILQPNVPAKQLLDASVAKINVKLINYTPPDVMARKRAIAWGIVALIGGFAAFFLTRSILASIRAARASSGSISGGSRLPLRIHLSAWTFMTPAVASVALWAYLPLLRGMMMAFQEYHLLGAPHWIGMDNFIEAVGQETFWIGIWNSIIFTVYILGFGFFLPVVIALLLNEIPRGKVFFRILYYLPAVTTSVVTAMLFKQFFDSTPHGLANTILGVLHHGPVKWLEDPASAKFAIIAPIIWASAGPGSIIYLAALQGIPDEMYEAADLDGAGFWTKIFRITLPTLSPLIVINLVGATIAAFKIMEPVLVQTGGGPVNATHTIGLEVFYNAFIFLKLGYATAAAWLMGSLLIGLTIYQLRVLQNVRYSSAGR